MTESPPVADRWIDTPHGRLFARIWPVAGAPPGRSPIVLFHDSLGSVALWRDFPTRLGARTGRTVVAYDRLGFGRSAPYRDAWGPDFIRREAERYFPLLRAQLGLTDFVAFGHSVGGAMAAHCAAAFPDACRALVTESAQAFVEDRTVAGILAAKAGFRQADQFERLRKYHGDKARWVLDAWTETWLSPGFAHWSLAAELGPVRCPALVLHGEEDEYGSESQPRRLAAALAGPTEVAILPRTRHVPHREAEGPVLTLVERFLEG